MTMTFYIPTVERQTRRRVEPEPCYYRETTGGCYATEKICKHLDCLSCPFDHCLEDDHPDRVHQQKVRYEG